MDNNVSIGRAERLSLQAEWLNARMAGVSNWKNSEQAPRLFTVSEKRAFVAWRQTEDGPRVIDVLRASDVEISFTAGITIMFTGTTSSTVAKLSTHPREILPGVYAWVPPFAEVRFCPHVFENPEGTWRMTLPIMVRASGDTVGSCHLTPLKEFRAAWPDLTV
jgi:hypothetical protein